MVLTEVLKTMKKNKKQVYNIKDFIGVFDNFIDDQICDQLIKGFLQEEKFEKTYGRAHEICGAPTQKKDVSCNVDSKNFDITFRKVNPLFKIAMENVLSLYLKETGIGEFLPKDINWSPFKIQRTEPSGGYHVWHVERSSFLLNRLLVFTVYLNDIKEGGETEFLYQKQRVSPKKGTACIFPAHFPYVHRGNPPLKGTKYIATGWFVTNSY